MSRGSDVQVDSDVRTDREGSIVAMLCRDKAGEIVCGPREGVRENAVHVRERGEFFEASFEKVIASVFAAIAAHRLRTIRYSSKEGSERLRESETVGACRIDGERPSLVRCDAGKVRNLFLRMPQWRVGAHIFDSLGRLAGARQVPGPQRSSRPHRFVVPQQVRRVEFSSCLVEA